MMAKTVMMLKPLGIPARIGAGEGLLRLESGEFTMDLRYSQSTSPQAVYKGTCPGLMTLCDSPCYSSRLSSSLSAEALPELPE